MTRSSTRSGWSAVDLHTHTTASDGSLTPEGLVALAVERGLRHLAVTDHDSTEGVDAARRAAQGTPLEVVPGVEINTDTPGGELHVLGYFLNHHDPQLADRLSRQRANRMGRGEGIVQRLHDLGIDVSWERVQAIAGAAEGGAVGRPHIARALVEGGYVGSIKEAFDRYIGNDGPAYVARAKLEPAEAVAIVHRAGGLPALAHPADIPELDGFLPGLIDAGMVGLECYYGVYRPEVVERMVAVARQLRARAHRRQRLPRTGRAARVRPGRDAGAGGGRGRAARPARLRPPRRTAPHPGGPPPGTAIRRGRVPPPERRRVASHPGGPPPGTAIRRGRCQIPDQRRSTCARPCSAVPPLSTTSTGRGRPRRSDSSWKAAVQVAGVPCQASRRRASASLTPRPARRASCTASGTVTIHSSSQTAEEPLSTRRIAS